MASAAKTVLATGVSSGLGFEAVKQLLQAPQPYRILIGARNVPAAQKAFDDISYDKSSGNSASVIPLELSNLNTVKSFAQETLEKLSGTPLDHLLLNAGMSDKADGPGPYGSSWCSSFIVNHISQYYLVHLLKDKLVSDKTRITFVSSGAIRNVPDPSLMDKDLRANTGSSDYQAVYSQSKFAQLLGAHTWRRALESSNRVIAVSPGLIPSTGLGRARPAKDVFNSAMKDHPDAKSNADGGANVLRAMLWDKAFPEDREQFFLTSWGEWWAKDVYQQSLDRDLQARWSWSESDIEKEAQKQADYLKQNQ